MTRSEPAICLHILLKPQRNGSTFAKKTEWPEIRTAFIAYFSNLVRKRTEYEARNYDQQEPLMQFIATKEEKAIAAGIPEDQAIKHLILNARLPFELAMNLAGRTFNTFGKFKSTVNDMIKILQNHPSVNFQQAYPPPSPARHFGRPYQSPYARYAQNNRFARKIPLCPECKKRGKHLRH